jgi:hypothetical protein
MAKKLKKQKLLPDTVFVYRDGEGEDEYLYADEDMLAAGDGTLIGVYELREVKVKRIKHTLETNA